MWCRLVGHSASQDGCVLCRPSLVVVVRVCFYVHCVCVVLCWLSALWKQGWTILYLPQLLLFLLLVLRFGLFLPCASSYGTKQQQTKLDRTTQSTRPLRSLFDLCTSLSSSLSLPTINTYTCTDPSTYVPLTLSLSLSLPVLIHTHAHTFRRQDFRQ